MKKIQLRQKFDKHIKAACSKLNPKQHLYIILLIFGLFIGISFHITISGFSNIRKDQIMNIQRIDRIPITRPTPDSLLILKDIHYEKDE